MEDMLGFCDQFWGLDHNKLKVLSELDLRQGIGFCTLELIFTKTNQKNEYLHIIKAFENKIDFV